MAQTGSTKPGHIGFRMMWLELRVGMRKKKSNHVNFSVNEIPLGIYPTSEICAIPGANMWNSYVDMHTCGLFIYHEPTEGAKPTSKSSTAQPNPWVARTLTETNIMDMSATPRRTVSQPLFLVLKLGNHEYPLVSSAKWLAGKSLNWVEVSFNGAFLWKIHQMAMEIPMNGSF